MAAGSNARPKNPFSPFSGLVLPVMNCVHHRVFAGLGPWAIIGAHGSPGASRQRQIVMA